MSDEFEIEQTPAQLDRAEFEQLVWTILDGRASDDEFAKLDTLLAGNAELQQHYLAVCDCHFEYERHALSEKSGQAEEESRQEKELSAISSQPSASSDTHHSPLTPHHSKKSWLDRASRRPVRPALAIAALVMISVVAWMGVTMVKTQIAGGGNKNTDELQKPTKPEFVAWLMKAHKTQWLHGTEPRKTRLMPSQRLAISKGLIEIQYRTRAVVVIEGPAEFFVGRKAVGNAVPGVPQRHRRRSLQDDLANSGYLAHGKLVARVEGKKAEGFTIETPNARVVDLGTEFGVEVRELGAARVDVIDGAVRVILDDDAQTTQKVVAGNAVEITAAEGDGTLAFAMATYDRHRYPQALPAISIFGPLPALPVTDDLALWFAADVGVKKDERGRVNIWSDLAVGDNVERNDAIQADARRRPRWVGNAIGGKPALRFDGVHSFLRVPKLALAKDQTWFLVFRPARAEGRRMFRHILQYETTYFAVAPIDRIRVVLEAKHARGMSTTIFPARGAPVIGKPTLATVRSDSKRKTADFRLDGVGNNEQPMNGSLATRTSVMLGGVDADGKTSKPFCGDLAEVLIYNRTLSNKQVDEVEAYLAGKYGMSLPNTVRKLSAPPRKEVVSPSND